MSRVTSFLRQQHPLKDVSNVGKVLMFLTIYGLISFVSISVAWSFIPYYWFLDFLSLSGLIIMFNSSNLLVAVTLKFRWFVRGVYRIPRLLVYAGIVLFDVGLLGTYFFPFNLILLLVFGAGTLLVGSVPFFGILHVGDYLGEMLEGWLWARSKLPYA